MFKHILIPTDGSELSRKAVLYGVQLAKQLGAKVTALTLTEPYRVASMDAVLVSVGEDEYEEESRRVSDQALEQVKMAADAAGVPCEAVRQVHDQPYRAIIDVAHARDCDLIVMASHGRRGVSALLLGSETVKVLTHSTIPVLVYR
jgi:nucleotide-binding universal stress UspA family protein